MPNDFFRIRLICVLLDTVGMCFDKGTQKRKLDNFLVFFQVMKVLRKFILRDTYSVILQYYVLCKEDLPMDVDFMLTDSIEVS
jgi:regulator of nonsense transcripts 2